MTTYSVIDNRGREWIFYCVVRAEAFAVKVQGIRGWR